MIPDSDVASKYKCGETKTKYLCECGLSPYFANLLECQVRKSSSVVILFDESLIE